MFKKITELLLKVLSKFLSYADYAEVVINVAKLFFNNLSEFIESLVKAEQPAIDEAIADPTVPDEQVEVLKLQAAARVEAAAAKEFSGSPTYVPSWIIRQVRDAWAYLTNHPNGDPEKEKSARQHGFFREHTTEELKEQVEHLNKGFTSYGT